MSSHHDGGGLRVTARAALSAGLAALSLVAIPAGAVAAAPSSPDFDVRDRMPPNRSNPAQADLRRSLGPDAGVTIDRVTGTPDAVGDGDGFLTGRERGSAEQIALRYVRDHKGTFGLDANDLASLQVATAYTTNRGLTHIEWNQVYRGIAAFDSGLRANVQGGRLVNVAGAPQPDLAVASTSPPLSAASATDKALATVGVQTSVKELHRRGTSQTTTLSGGNLAGLVLFVEPTGARLAWSIIASGDGDSTYRMVVDASTGAVLKRTDLAEHDASVSAFPYYPGAAQGGTQAPQVASTDGDDRWLGFGFTKLRGDNAWAYSDQNDNLHFHCTSTCAADADPGPANDVAPSSGGGTSSATFDYPQIVDTSNSTAGRNCPPAGCSWNGFALNDSPFSAGNNWQQNRAQAATQAFYFVNTFHDYLQSDPGIQFDDASGNFEETSSVQGPTVTGNDPVHVQVDDGAAKGSGGNFPDPSHARNANMTTLPEKDAGDPTGVPYPFRAPKMQMYLFTGNGSSGTYDVNGSDDAAIVYHEYTHGLSNRLVDSQGTGLLDSKQGGAMGEAWSDWYAMDYLNAQGLQPDVPSTPDVAFGVYENFPIRTQPMDCPVAARTGSPPGPANASCPGGHAPWRGGYTYGDFAKISSGGAEVHSDGEIWGETLWQLRTALIQADGTATGQFRARALITDGMRLSSVVPTFLSMRDSILQANGAEGFGTADCRTIWGVFANRGMGSDATTTGTNDTSPHAGFTDPSGSAAFCPTGTATSPGAVGSPAVPGSQPVAPPQPAPSKPAKPRFTGSAASVRVSSSGRFAYTFRATPALTGRVTFPTVSKVRVSRRARITLAAATFAVPPSGKVTVRPKLSRTRLKVLKRHRSMKVRATIVVKTIFGLSSQATRTLTLKAPRSTR